LAKEVTLCEVALECCVVVKVLIRNALLLAEMALFVFFVEMVVKLILIEKALLTEMTKLVFGFLFTSLRLSSSSIPWHKMSFEIASRIKSLFVQEHLFMGQAQRAIMELMLL